MLLAYTTRICLLDRGVVSYYSASSCTQKRLEKSVGIRVARDTVWSWEENTNSLDTFLSSIHIIAIIQRSKVDVLIFI